MVCVLMDKFDVGRVKVWMTVAIGGGAESVWMGN